MKISGWSSNNKETNEKNFIFDPASLKLIALGYLPLTFD